MWPGAFREPWDLMMAAGGGARGMRDPEYRSQTCHKCVCDHSWTFLDGLKKVKKMEFWHPPPKMPKSRGKTAPGAFREPWEAVMAASGQDVGEPLAAE